VRLQAERVEQLAQVAAVGVRFLVLVGTAFRRLADEHVGDLPADVERQLAQLVDPPEGGREVGREALEDDCDVWQGSTAAAPYAV